jgi:hypothetical protein
MPSVETTKQKELRIRTELANNLGPEATFEFSNDIPAGAPKFSSAAELKGIMSSSNLVDVSNSINNGNIDLFTLKFAQGFNVSVAVTFTKSTLDPNVFEIEKKDAVVSEASGSSLLFYDWTQFTYDVTTNDQNPVYITKIDLYGFMHYKIFFKDLGTIIKQQRHIVIKYNAKTKQRYSVEELTGGSWPGLVNIR